MRQLAQEVWSYARIGNPLARGGERLQRRCGVVGRERGFVQHHGVGRLLVVSRGDVVGDDWIEPCRLERAGELTSLGHGGRNDEDARTFHDRSPVSSLTLP